MNQYPLVYLDHVTKNYGHEVAPVSYTHLDVYKRQVKPISCEFFHDCKDLFSFFFRMTKFKSTYNKIVFHLMHFSCIFFTHSPT